MLFIALIMDNERKHAGGGDNHMSDEFTIRVSGAAPPPIPTATLTSGKNIKKKSGKKRDACAMPQQRRIELKLHPSSTLNDLRRNVLASYDVPDAARNAYDVSFLGGFPPRPMCEGKDGDTSIYELGIRPNESLIVKFILVDEHDTHAEGSASTTTSSEDNSSQQPDTSSSSSSNNNLGGREKRASAVAATASFRDVIAAQDAAMKASSSTKNKNGSNRNAGSSKRIAATTLGGGSSVTAGVKRPKPVRMEGTGFRLSDGKSFAGSSSPMAKKKGSREGEGAFKNEDDVANRLLSSLGGGGGGNVGKYLRSAMRSAVSKSYEASRASVRVASVDAGEYSLQIVKSGTVMVGGGVVLGTANDHRKTEEGDDTVDHDVDLGRTLFVASYSKGMDGRGTYEETVEIIGLAILRSVLESVYNTDPSSNDDDEYGPPKTEDGRLRPVLIAQLSPRVFWSLVYHCGGGDDGSSGGEDRQLTAPRPCVEDMLRTVLPQLDWSHFDRGGRLRALSEKARENLRQTTANKESQDDDDDHAEARVKAIEDLAESVLNAADEEEEVHLTESERRARAALARFGNDKDANTTSSLKTDVSSCEDNWTLVTPIEDDIDELMECIMECKPEEGDTYNEEAAGRWAGLLIKSDVRNWREMANSDPQYVYSLIGNCSVAKILQETVEQWVDAARIRSLEEIMLDILDSDQDALEALQDKARSCSPRDLMLWKSAPAMLIEAVSPPDERRWEEADAVRWISRAKIALSTCPWLNYYNFNS